MSEEIQAPPTEKPKRAWPRYKAGPVEYWLAEAITQFLNGFIAGWKQGVGTGAGTGAISGLNPQLAANLTAWQQIMLSGGATICAMMFNGANQFSRWHETNPFPNPWPPPSGNTNPPILPSK